MQAERGSWLGIIDAISDWLKLLALIVLVTEAFLTAVIIRTGEALPYTYLGIGLSGLIVVGLFYDRRLSSRPHERRLGGEADETPALPSEERVTVHYVAPTLAYNEYYAHLQVRLEAEFSKVGDVYWQYHEPPGNAPEDIYLRLQGLMEVACTDDVILLVPKGLDNRERAAHVSRLLSEHPLGHIVFLDQPPPEHLLSTDRTSFIGVDNRKVGILAAFALHAHLEELGNYKYCIVHGPGGNARVQGFMDGVRFFDPDHDVEPEPFDIGDVDRIEGLPQLRQLIQSYPSNTSLGIFAGNDETAVAVLESLVDLDSREVLVVGCDSTRGMRLAVDGNDSAALATIETHVNQQAQKIVQVVQKRKVVEYQEPTLYPITLDLEFRRSLETDRLNRSGNGEDEKSSGHRAHYHRPGRASRIQHLKDGRGHYLQRHHVSQTRSQDGRSDQHSRRRSRAASYLRATWNRAH